MADKTRYTANLVTDSNLYVDIINDRVGIGTTNPTSKLQVSGNVNITGVTTLGTVKISSGIITASSGIITYYGDGSKLSNLPTSLISISTNTTNSNQLIPYTVSTGNTTGFGVTNTFVFNPSTGNIGIGVTNPTSKLQVSGNVNITGVTTSSELISGELAISGISSYNQVGILTGSFAIDANDFFGYSVATSADGKTIVVGTDTDEIGATTGTGVVYVFDRVGNSFNQVGILTGSFAIDSNDGFGYSVATSADGKTIVVGAHPDEIGATTSTGIAYVFDRIGNSFNQVGILTGSFATDSNDSFGISVATSADGNTIIVGAFLDEVGATADTGVVYVFDRVGNSFNQVGILTGSFSTNSLDQFGNSVATSSDGNTIVVSARYDEIGATTGTGVVYVFDRVGNSFNQVGILTGSFATESGDVFGWSVATSADGKTIVVGAREDELSSSVDTGVVYVFDRVGNSFNQVGILNGSLATNSYEYFGNSVATSADGKTIVVGAYQDEPGATAGTGVAYVFKRVGNSFNQVGILTGSFAIDSNDRFGWSVATSADGKTIVVGATNDEIGATTGTGIAYVFDEIRDTYYVIDSSRNLSNITSFDSTVTSIWDTVGITTLSKTLVNRENITVTEAGTTITLPASPSAGWEVAINVGNFINTTVERNGSNIMGLAENIVIDYTYASLTFIYTGNATQGWRIY